MRIVFAGTPNFASQHLSLLMESNHEIIKVLTQPDRKSGRGKKIKISEVKQLAVDNNIEILQPDSLKTDEFEKAFKDLNPDLFLVVAYGLIIPKSILDIPTKGCVNVHGSILPRWRGASPMEHSILKGDKKSGITYMQMSEGLDEGPIYETHECSLNTNDQLEDLERKLIGLSKQHFLPFLKSIEKGAIQLINQPNEEATFAPKITKEMLQINWTQETAQEVIRRINALGSKYGTYTFLGSKRIKIFSVTNSAKIKEGRPGQIIETGKGPQVICKDGCGVILEIMQMEGKNKVTGNEFLMGYKNLLETFNHTFSNE